MGTTDCGEIRIDGCELIVSPKSGTMNRRKSARILSSQISDALEVPRPSMVADLIFDFRHVHWISSVGLNELIEIQRQMRANGISLKLRAMGPSVRDVFRITRLERIFEFSEEDLETVQSS